MILYRPMGQAEYDLIAQTDFAQFPPRLPEQPIFYPVLNQQYAHEIAEKWNTRYADSGYKGYYSLEFEGIEDNLMAIEISVENLHRMLREIEG